MTNYSPIYTSAEEVYARTGLTNSEVDLIAYDYIIRDAETEVELLTGKKYTTGNARVGYFSMPDKDITDTKPTTVWLSNFPIQSIVEFKTLDVNGAAISTYGTLTSVQIAAGTFETTDYWLEVKEDAVTGNIIPTGKITLKTASFSKGTNNVKVSYTYGYTSVPTAVKELACCLAGIRAWLRFLGCGYNRLNSYAIPQQSVDKGDFYIRGKQNIDLLTDEANRTLDRVGRKPRTLYFATGG